MPFTIEKVPLDAQAISPPAYYMPMPDKGIYFVNTGAPETRALYEIYAFCLHEAIPGHHMQFAVMKGN